MSTPETPRPSLDDTLALIDDTLAAQTALPPLPPTVGDYLAGIPLDVRPTPCRCVVTPIVPEVTPEQAAAFTAVRDGNTFTLNKPGVYELTWNPGGSGEPSLAEQLLRHRRSCPHEDGPVTDCPGCAAVDADLTAAKAAAAPEPPERGWLARALHRLFGSDT